jgi:hypothetical protein
MDTEITKLEKLLAEKNFTEAKKVIGDIVSAKMSDLDKGQALVGVASIYLDISNAINENYRATLEEAIAGMKALNSEESKVNDKIRVAELKEDLHGYG